MTVAQHTLPVVDFGTLAYQPAWDRQLDIHAQVLAGELPHGALIFVEHPPVITIGRRTNAGQHLLAPPQLLAARGVEIVETDRGGDITFHGPGQLVVYPIIPLNHYGLNLHGYMRLLEQVVIDTVAAWGVQAHRDPPPCSATGVWVDQGEAPQISGAPHPAGAYSAGAPHGNAVVLEQPQASISQPSSDASKSMAVSHHESPSPPHCLAVLPATSAKLAAIGIKLKRWITLHGLALNVTTDLSYFNLINPCGLSRPVTSLQKLLGPNSPEIPAVKARLAAAFNARLQKPMNDLTT